MVVAGPEIRRWTLKKKQCRSHGRPDHDFWTFAEFVIKGSDYGEWQESPSLRRPTFAAEIATATTSGSFEGQ